LPAATAAAQASRTPQSGARRAAPAREQESAMADNAFPPAELDARLRAVRAEMAARDLDALVVSLPENIYYLTGLDHWGFFACHLLIVPRDGEMVAHLSGDGGDHGRESGRQRPLHGPSRR
jgi:hypothetical protein